MGRGVTSEVYRLDDEKVLKLFTKDYSKEVVDYEAGIAYEVQRLNVSAPKIYGIVTIGERYGIVYEYIKGMSLADELSNNRQDTKAIEEIIDEECAAAIAGEKSAEEVAEILDSRLGIYLSERS